uniref:Myosin tail domain-containing protein n=1 Tax=Ciona savignyi TaxID=51511 RepID=H2YQ93_CIOSA
MKELYRSMEDDRRSIMSEVTQQNKLVDSLSKEKTSLLLENKEARMIVQDLEDRVSNLTADLETESKKERERIEERYNRYKSTITSLQADLEEKKGNHHDGGIPMRMGRSPSPIKRVTISESPTIHGYSIRPRSSSPKVYPEKDR